MAQFARPSADVTVSSWSNQAASTVNIFNAINEAVQENTSYVQSQLAPTSNLWYVAKLSSIEDPLTSASHSVRYSYRKSTGGGAQIDLEVELRINYASTVSPGTSIASWTHSNLTSAWVTSTQALSAAQADAITAYSSMFLVFKPAQV